MACMIATLDMHKAKDDNGNDIEPELVFKNQVFRTPSPFKSSIRPRSEQAVKVIRLAAEA